MDNAAKLILVKILHTIIWLFFNIVIFYMLYAAVANKLDKYLWACYGLVFLEGTILIIFKNVCPVTLLASNYSRSKKDNFDIYLPNWLARFNKQIYISIVVIIIFITIYQLSKAK
ncbi:hypothetical protein [Dyadobacter frigoris]|uniref:DUF2784 domain-containing protein n=1 Tax=Dyadobacter frigoris TaxID=2576211 RepID=A0A4U6CP84_9BACT|nr:hypothetical protein [Dyadobacter frigoris]TKT86240.1 hypothetical protein FDK13_32520 [Dyadobacter frigoris]GLU56919.1 hypothetical protein Dfri01_63800 [Dyadobacter frigoris]